jgi:hypothetical protein
VLAGITVVENRFKVKDYQNRLHLFLFFLVSHWQSLGLKHNSMLIKNPCSLCGLVSSTVDISFDLGMSVIKVFLTRSTISTPQNFSALICLIG